MKRVAFVFPYNTWGGAFRSTYELTNRLIDKGYKIDILFPIWSPKEEKKSWRGYLAWRTRSLLRAVVRRNNIPWFKVNANVRCIPIIHTRFFQDYDCIVANHWNTAQPVYNLNVQAEKFYYIRDVEQWAPYFEQEVQAFHLPLRRVVVAEWIRLYLKSNFNLDSDVVTNGTNPVPFLVDKKQHSMENPVLSMVYATHPMKAMDYAKEVLTRVKELRPNVRIRAFGFVRPPGNWAFIDGFDLRPTGERLRAVYAESDIFFCPSDQEGYHNPPREAMVAEAALVATNVGCIPDLSILDVNMKVIEPRDLNGAISAIIQLIDDRDLRISLSREAKKTILQSTWDMKVEQFAELLERK